MPLAILFLIHTMSLIVQRSDEDFLNDYRNRTAWTAKLLVQELRDELDKRGQSRDGLKATLALRLDEV